MGVFDVFTGSDEPEDIGIPKYTGPSGNDQWGNQAWGGYGGQMVNGQLQPGTGAAQQDVDRYRAMGQAAANRAAYQLDYSGANNALNFGYADRANALDARQQQLEAADASRYLAQGGQSVATQLGQRALDQGVTAQYAAASSAPMGMGQAVAMRQAQMGEAGTRAAGMNQIRAAAADEQAAARQRYAQQMDQIRRMDAAGMQQGTEMGATAANMARAQADLEARQRYLNQQGELYGEGKAYDVNQTNLNAQQSFNELGQREHEQKRRNDMNNKRNTVDMATAAIGGLTGGVSHILPFLADGGPVQAGKPVVVGERGPEVIVPATSGMVVPNHVAFPTLDNSQVVPLMDSDAGMLHQGPDGRAYYDAGAVVTPTAPSISGDVRAAKSALGVKDSSGGGEAVAARAPVTLAAVAAKRPPKPRQLTPEEMLALADQYQKQMAAEHAARMSEGPAILVKPQ